MGRPEEPGPACGDGLHPEARAPSRAPPSSPAPPYALFPLLPSLPARSLAPLLRALTWAGCCEVLGGWGSFGVQPGSHLPPCLPPSFSGQAFSCVSPASCPGAADKQGAARAPLHVWPASTPSGSGASVPAPGLPAEGGERWGSCGNPGVTSPSWPICRRGWEGRWASALRAARRPRPPPMASLSPDAPRGRLCPSVWALVMSATAPCFPFSCPWTSAGHVRPARGRASPGQPAASAERLPVRAIGDRLGRGRGGSWLRAPGPGVRAGRWGGLGPSGAGLGATVDFWERASPCLSFLVCHREIEALQVLHRSRPVRRVSPGRPLGPHGGQGVEWRHPSLPSPGSPCASVLKFCACEAFPWAEEAPSLAEQVPGRQAPPGLKVKFWRRRREEVPAGGPSGWKLANAPGRVWRLQSLIPVGPPARGRLRRHA